MATRQLADSKYEAEHEKVHVIDLREGDLVDMQRDPYLLNHPMAEFLYATVYYVTDEGNGIVAVGYESMDEVGYDKDQELWRLRVTSED